MIPLHLKEWDDKTTLTGNSNGITGTFFDDPCLPCLKNKEHKTRWECEKHTLIDQDTLRWKVKMKDFVESLETIKKRGRRIPA